MADFVYGVVEEYIGALHRPRWAFFMLPYNTGLYALVIARVCHDKVRDESVLLKYRTERCFCSHGY